MINIQEHNGLSNVSMQALVDKHFEEIIREKKTKPGEYRTGSIILAFDAYKKKADSLDANYFKSYANSKKTILKKQVAFFDELGKNNYKGLKELLTGNPDNLDTYRKNINAKYGLNLFFDKAGNKQTSFGDMLSTKIFNYKRFRSSAFCASQMSSLGFARARCPYCGYMLVEVISVKPSDPKGKKDKALLDLDHFFSKSQSPYLAISFYNLIPSCHNCNSIYKGVKLFELNTHIHPYKDSFDDHYEFITVASSGITPDTIKLEKRSSFGTDYQNNVDFDLLKRYNNAKEELLKIEQLYQKLWKRWKDEDIPSFKEYMLQGFPQSKFDILKFEYAKAKRDILKSVDFAKVFATY